MSAHTPEAQARCPLQATFKTTVISSSRLRQEQCSCYKQSWREIHLQRPRSTDSSHLPPSLLQDHRSPLSGQLWDAANPACSRGLSGLAETPVYVACVGVSRYDEGPFPARANVPHMVRQPLDIVPRTHCSPQPRSFRKDC